MSSRARRTRQRGFALVIVLATGLVLLIMIGVLARLATYELADERAATVSARAVELAHAAQAWTRLHGATLAVDDQRTLDVHALLPPGMAGEVTLTRRGDGDPPARFECRVSLSAGATQVRRTFDWPAHAPTSADAAVREQAAVSPATASPPTASPAR
jgi:hypothetical protein